MFSGDSKCVEDVLEAYIQEDISSEERVEILTMVGRLRRILHWNSFEDSVLFDKSRGPDIIEDILEHCPYLFKRSPYTHIQEQDFIVYTLAALCFYYRINNSYLMANVLSVIYSYDGNFSSIFYCNFPGNSIKPMCVNTNNEKRQLMTMLYFLLHAQRARLQFQGSRFIDVPLFKDDQIHPVTWASVHHKPSLLLLLLRHGACLDDCGPSVPPSGMLARQFTRMQRPSNLLNFFTHMDYVTHLSDMILRDALQCLRILLRVFRQASMKELNSALIINPLISGSKSGSKISLDFIRVISERGIPHLLSRYTEPSELQHLCRCTIRESLNKNWNLPYGIPSLPLPTALQNYIDLHED